MYTIKRRKSNRVGHIDLGNKKGKPSQRQQPLHKEEEKDYREVGVGLVSLHNLVLPNYQYNHNGILHRVDYL